MRGTWTSPRMGGGLSEPRMGEIFLLEFDFRREGRVEPTRVIVPWLTSESVAFSKLLLFFRGPVLCGAVVLPALVTSACAILPPVVWSWLLELTLVRTSPTKNCSAPDRFLCLVELCWL